MFKTTYNTKRRPALEDSLCLAYKALDKAEELFDQNNLIESQSYFEQADGLYNNWCMLTGQGDHEASRRLENWWQAFMKKMNQVNDTSAKI